MMKVRFRAEKIWGRVWKEIFIIPTIRVSVNNCFYLCDNLRINIWFLIFGLTVDFVFEGRSYV